MELLFLYQVMNLILMSNEKIITAAFIITVATLFASSSTIANPIFAQSNNEEDNTDLNNYQDFVNCLTENEGEKEYATENEIRDCFRPIYDPTAVDSSSNSDDDDEGDDEDGDNN